MIQIERFHDSHSLVVNTFWTNEGPAPVSKQGSHTPSPQGVAQRGHVTQPPSLKLRRPAGVPGLA